MRRKKLTVSLSDKTLLLLAELRALTDADTDSEVVRNAMRVHRGVLAQAAQNPAHGTADKSQNDK